MNLLLSQPLLEEIGAAMVRSSPEGWRRIGLDVTAAANVTRTTMRVDLNDESVARTTIDDEGQDAVERLREVMHRDDTGTWYNATLTVDESGKLVTQFDYDNPPFGGIYDENDLDSGTADPELLREDHRMYPRADEHLPAWHPARTS